jgi:hypothetical protein
MGNPLAWPFVNCLFGVNRTLSLEDPRGSWHTSTLRGSMVSQRRKNNQSTSQSGAPVTGCGEPPERIPQRRTQHMILLCYPSFLPQSLQFARIVWLYLQPTSLMDVLAQSPWKKVSSTEFDNTTLPYYNVSTHVQGVHTYMQRCGSRAMPPLRAPTV